MSPDELTPEALYGTPRARALIEMLRTKRPGATHSSSVSAVPGAGMQPTATPALDHLGRPTQERADAARAAADAADAEPLGLDDLRALARNRSEGSQRALVLALAAQQAGKEFQPLASHFLQQSRSAAEPVRLDHGMLADGDYVADPAYGRAKRVDAMRRQADNLERLASQERVAQERREEEARRHGDNLALRREIEEGRRADRAAGNSLRADIAAAMRTDRARKETDAADEKRRAGVDRDVQSLSKRAEDLAPLAQAAREVEDMISQYGDQSIPGVGYTAALPGVMLSREGTLNRAKVQSVANALLKALSGAAVTLSEEQRLAAQTLSNGRYSEAEFRQAWPLLRGSINAGIDNLTAGFRPEVVETYQQRGGGVRRVGTPKQAAKDASLTPEEQRELEALRARFGGRR